ncbi:unnamed protein product [Acanthocheilonema viteae]|uniref:Uncharacterized protein n=1 Tax=Acanthocheilonema viteae TaxID=6277 RepID=A0A498S063_ACAVI|nr:unnamed protein product [Acanthocheilonema viteae]
MVGCWWCCRLWDSSMTGVWRGSGGDSFSRVEAGRRGQQLSGAEYCFREEKPIGGETTVPTQKPSFVRFAS